MSKHTNPPRPRDQLDLRDTLQTFAQGIVRNPARYNLREDQASEIQQAVDAYAATLALVTKPDRKTRVTVKEKDVARRHAEAIHSIYYNRIKNDPDVADADKLAINVLPVNPERTAIHVPSLPPMLDVLGATNGQHTLHFRNAGTVKHHGPDERGIGRSGKPHGAAFLQLYAAIGSGKDQPLKNAREVGLFTRNPVVVSHEAKDNGKQACYWARWISPTGKAGPWSLVTSMAIAA